MDEFTHGGTPPTLWSKARALQNPTNYQSRIAALARQVEKLSWMLEWMDEYMHISEPANLANAEEAWEWQCARSEG